MSLQFRVRPSSALQVGSNLVPRSPRYDFLGREGFNAWTGALDELRRPNTTRVETDDPYGEILKRQANQGFGWSYKPELGGSIPSVNPANVPSGLNNLKIAPVPGMQAPNYGASVRDAAELYNNGVNAGLDAELEYIGLQRELEMQERQLREAMLNGDIAKAKELLRDIEANRQALALSYEKFRGTVNPYYDAEVAGAGAAGAAAKEELAEIGEETAGELLAAGEAAEGATEGFGALIGNTAAGVEAAKQMAAVGLAEFGQYVEGRNTASLAIAGAQQSAGELGAEGDRMFTLFEIANREKRAMAGFDEKADQAADALTDLQMRKRLFDIEKKRSDLAHQKSLQDAYGKIEPMDSITFGRATAEQYFLNRASALGIDDDRQALLLDLWGEAFGDGVFSRSEWNKWLGADRSDEDGLQGPDANWITRLSAAEKAMLGEMFGAYESGKKSWNEGTIQPRGGGGGGSGHAGHTHETSYNKQLGGGARDPNSGLYYKRQQFATQMIPQLKQMFGLSRVGQWRSTNVACGGNTNRSCTSDHYTGGALDLHGTKASMAAAAQYLRNQPWVASVIYNSPGHYDHVHISLNLQYFK